MPDQATNIKPDNFDSNIIPHGVRPKRRTHGQTNIGISDGVTDILIAHEDPYIRQPYRNSLEAAL